MYSDSKSHTVAEAIDAIERLDRRNFMKFSLAAAALLAAGGASASIPDGIRYIGGGEYAVFERLMTAMFPTDGTKLAPLSQIPVMQTLDAALLAGMRPAALDGLKAGIRFFEQGPLGIYGKTFSALDEHQAAAFCDAWEASGDPMQRGLTTALKKLVALSYWANPPTWAALGYDGPVSRSWKLVAQGNAPAPQR